MSGEVVNLAQKFAQIDEHWHPHLAGALNGQHVRLVKLKGEFTWHHHEHEDELFFVVSSAEGGLLEMRFRDRTALVKPGEFIIVPRGVEHCPYAEHEVQVMLFEPASTINTGNVREARTRAAVPAV